MPHVYGHIQNSFLRLVSGTKFTKSVGVLSPHYTGKKLPGRGLVNRGKLDYPILFFNDEDTALTYGQQIVFLPRIIGRRTDGKYLVVATSIVDKAIHDASQGRINTAVTPQVKKAINKVNLKEKDYQENPDTYDSYDIIYCGGPGTKAIGKAGIKKKRLLTTSDAVIEWIVNNAVSFDEMNLGTN